MKISILTMCPEMFDSFFRDHVIERARKLHRLELNIVDIRGFADGCYRKVDDSPYGGGAGMILRIDPVMKAVQAVRREEEASCVTALAPIGDVYDQSTAIELAELDHLILICGHYEGMDARIYGHADRIISVGDYILSGGEIAAMAIADSVARLLPDVIRQQSLHEESFSGGGLEYPQYTRPADYHGEKVPQVLLSGDHGAVTRWRMEQAKALTLARRPDLLQKKEGGEGTG